MRNYLLEKSRVVNQAPGEQNFHIFYLLFAGLARSDARMDFDLQDPSFYRCINSNPAAIRAIQSQKTVGMVEELQEVLQVVGFTDEQRDNMWGLLSGILHLANLTFAGEDAVKVTSDDSLIAAVCNQLEIDEGTLELALTRSIILMRGEETERAYRLHEAEDCRDAAVKSIYERLFSWLFRQCNIMLRLKNEEETDRFVGILDIFGFECFDHNSFEQLCINLANEQLQYFFNDHSACLVTGWGHGKERGELPRSECTQRDIFSKGCRLSSSLVSPS
jgi:myosin-3